MNERADDQAINKVGPLTAFCGVAAIAAAVLVGSLIQPAASVPQVQAQPLVNALETEPVPEPVLVSMSPEQIEQMRTVSNLVSGAAAPVKVAPVKAAAATSRPSLVSPSPAAIVMAQRTVPKVRSVAKKATRPATASRTRTAKVSKTRTAAPVAVAAKRAIKHAAKDQRRKERVQRRADQRELWFHQWSGKHSHRPAHRNRNQHPQHHHR